MLAELDTTVDNELLISWRKTTPEISDGLYENKLYENKCDPVFKYGIYTTE